MKSGVIIFYGCFALGIPTSSVLRAQNAPKKGEGGPGSPGCEDCHVVTPAGGSASISPKTQLVSENKAGRVYNVTWTGEKPAGTFACGNDDEEIFFGSVRPPVQTLNNLLVRRGTSSSKQVMFNYYAADPCKSGSFEQLIGTGQGWVDLYGGPPIPVDNDKKPEGDPITSGSGKEDPPTLPGSLTCTGADYPAAFGEVSGNKVDELKCEEYPPCNDSSNAPAAVPSVDRIVLAAQWVQSSTPGRVGYYRISQEEVASGSPVPDRFLRKKITATSSDDGKVQVKECTICPKTGEYTVIGSILPPYDCMTYELTEPYSFEAYKMAESASMRANFPLEFSSDASVPYAELTIAQDESWLVYKKMRYKFLMPTGSTGSRTIHWAEVFHPQGGGPPEYSFKSETVNGAESRSCIIDPDPVTSSKQGVWTVVPISFDLTLHQRGSIADPGVAIPRPTDPNSVYEAVTLENADFDEQLNWVPNSVASAAEANRQDATNHSARVVDLVRDDDLVRINFLLSAPRMPGTIELVIDQAGVGDRMEPDDLRFYNNLGQRIPLNELRISSLANPQGPLAPMLELDGLDLFVEIADLGQLTRAQNQANLNPRRYADLILRLTVNGQVTEQRARIYRGGYWRNQRNGNTGTIAFYDGKGRHQARDGGWQVDVGDLVHGPFDIQSGTGGITNETIRGRGPTPVGWYGLWERLDINPEWQLDRRTRRWSRPQQDHNYDHRSSNEARPPLQDTAGQ